MTGLRGGPREPGAMLLKLARLLFNDDVLSVVVQPTLSDLQREVATAGPGRLHRLRARCRGYCAFWKLVLVVPFASWASPAANAGGMAFADAIARVAAGSIVVTMLAVVGPVFGAWVAAVTACGALFALVIHAWYVRHPSNLPTPSEAPKRWPQINFSSTEVAGNIGGLIFAVGSVFIIAIGLPSVIWFLLAGTAAGCFVAWGLITWHTTHANDGLPENRIVLR